MSNEIFLGDCIELCRAAIPDNSIQAVITDPPYNIGIDYGAGSQADSLPADKYCNWCAEWIAEAYRVLKPSGSIFIVSGQEYGASLDLLLQDKGFTIRNRITWAESFGVYCHSKFGRCSRPILYAVKDHAEAYFDGDSIRVPSARQTKYRDKRANPLGKIPGDVWEFSRVCGTFAERVHDVPTQLPEKLVERMILCSTAEHDTILDLFSGSGTIGAVAKALNRESVSFEINSDYLNISSKRFDKIYPGQMIKKN